MSQLSNFRLLDLPQELINHVVRFCQTQDLSSLRLVCKASKKPATEELFRKVYIRPIDSHVKQRPQSSNDDDLAPSHISRWSNIADNDTLRHHPRHATIHTQPDLERIDHGRDDRELEEITESYEKAIAALGRFPNLESVEIGFTCKCQGVRPASRWWRGDAAEDVEQRVKMLELIFRAIQARALSAENKAIRKLSIVNLQNCPIPDFTSSELFCDVMSNLEELHLSMIQESNEHGPDHDWTRIELRTWPSHLCSEWLRPIASNLKALSLYSRCENWGPFPGYYDFSKLSFPNLATLSLGYYTIAHDSDLDWILGIKSLRRLVLSNCMIASWINIEKENFIEWSVQQHDWSRLSKSFSEDWSQDFAYGGEWNMFFDRIREELPNLVDFRFDYALMWSPHGKVPYGMGYRHAVGQVIPPQRYVCFDNGILPTHWPECRRDDGELHCWLDGKRGFPRNMHKETLEADQKSLDDLLTSLK